MPHPGRTPPQRKDLTLSPPKGRSRRTPARVLGKTSRSHEDLTLSLSKGEVRLLESLDEARGLVGPHPEPVEG
jgi:hypothetical protein